MFGVTAQYKLRIQNVSKKILPADISAKGLVKSKLNGNLVILTPNSGCQTDLRSRTLERPIARVTGLFISGMRSQFGTISLSNSHYLRLRRMQSGRAEG